MSKLRSQLNNLRSSDANTGLLEPNSGREQTSFLQSPGAQQVAQAGSFLGEKLPHVNTRRSAHPVRDAEQDKRALDAEKNRRELAEVKTSLRELTEILIKSNNAKSDLASQAQIASPQPASIDIDTKQLAGSLSKSLSTSLSDTLQKDLREQLSAEIETMRNELANLQQSASKASDREVLEDIKRISQGIHELQNRQVVSPKQFTEITGDLRNMHRDIRSIGENQPEPVNSIEITQSIQDSYSEIAKRLDSIGTSQSSDQIDKLNEKLEVIKVGLSGTDPQTLVRIEGQLEALGDGISTLASSIESGLGSPNEQPGALNDALPTYFDNLDRRMDEITRAVMASAPSAQITNDEAAFDRIEARINSLAKSIENIAPANDTSAQNEQLASLMQVPDQLQNTIALLDRLEERVAHAHVQPTNAENNSNEEFGSLIATLTQKIDQLQLAAATDHQQAQPQMTGADEEVNNKLDAMALTLERAVNSGDGSVEQLQSQIAELSNRIEIAVNADHQEQTNRNQLDDRIFDEIQALAVRIEQFDNGQPGIENHNHQLGELQNQITAIASQLQSFNGGPDLGAIENRLGGIENQNTAISALADELKSLTASSSELKGHSLETFDAVRDSLAMILDRINGIEIRIAEEETSIASEPVQSEQTHEENHNASMVNAAREYANSLNSSNDLPNAQDYPLPTAHSEEYFAENTAANELPHVEAPSLDLQHLPESTDAMQRAGDVTEQIVAEPDHDAEMILPGDDLPLEPGSGAPDLTSKGPDMDALMRQAKDNKRKQTLENEQQNPTDFIAAARRAAQAAASDAEAMSKTSSVTAETDKPKSSLSTMLAKRKKPLMFGAVAVLLAVAAVPAFNYFMTSKPVEVVENISDPTPQITPVNASEDPTTQSADLETTASAEPAKDAPLPKTRQIEMPSQMASALSTNDIRKDGEAASSIVSEQSAQDELDAITNKQITSAPMPPAEVGPIALRQAAAIGNSKAIFEVGRRYTSGINGTPDFAKAAEWYQRAADAGFAPAQYRLGNFYEKGHGLPSDANKAAQWYKRAAEQGNALAMHNLAVINAMGVLTNGADMREASKWFEQAAEHGVKDSQVNLGIVFAKAMGVEANLPEAYKWFAIAAKAGDKDAAQKRDTIAKQMRPEQLEEARGKVELWQPKELKADSNNVEIPSEWKTSQQVTASLSSKQMIKKSQALLTKLGFKPGPADGLMGAKTVSAIKKFQSRAGINTNGKVSMELLGALEKSRN